MHKVIGLMALTVLTAAGCGGDGGSSKVGDAERPYVDAVAQSLREDPTMPLDDEQVECLAEQVVSAIGVDSFEESGVTPDDIAGGADLSAVGALSDDQANEIIDAFFSGDCFDFVQVLAESFMTEEGGGLNEEQATCVAEKFLENDAFKQAFASSLTGDQDVNPDEAVGDVFEVFAACDISLTDLGS